MAAYGALPKHGNSEGKNTLEFVGDMNQRATLTEARRAPFEAREKRVRQLGLRGAGRRSR